MLKYIDLCVSYFKENLQIRESPTDGVYVHGLTQVVVTSLFEVLNLIKQGVKNRITQSTTMVTRESYKLIYRINLQAEVMP
jgi:Kinesin-like protein